MSLLVAFAIFCVIGLLKLVQALLEVPVIKAFVTRTNDAVKKRQELARELLDMQRELLVISPKVFRTGSCWGELTQNTAGRVCAMGQAVARVQQKAANPQPAE